MDYFLVGFVSVVITYFLCKKVQKKEIEELLLGVEHTEKCKLKSIEQSLSNKAATAFKQKEILYLISDGIHNIGKYYKENPSIEKDEFLKKLGNFFAMNRTLSQNIFEDNYSEDRYEKIVNFIEEDFHDFCHYKTQDLDCEKYWNLIFIDKC